MAVYSSLARPLLFRAEPERVHDATIRVAEIASGSRLACRAVAARRPAPDPRLAVEVAGLRMRSPIGLAAGFDKSARAVPFLAALGFGHVEVGSISAEPSAGNPRPRLFRLPADRAVVVHYGVPNDGAARAAERLSRPRPAVPVGVNVVSTNRGQDESDDAILADYVTSVQRLQDRADYVVLNLSCPNTRDGRGFFADRGRLRELLSRLATLGVRRPLFVKVAPDGDVDSLLAAVAPHAFVDGFSVNLPPGKPAGLEHVSMPGAVSGAPAAAAALRTVAELRAASSDYVIFGSGGVFTAGDAYAMIRAGADLLQLYTALIYEGPGVIGRITRGLAVLLERDGHASVGSAVGSGERRH